MSGILTYPLFRTSCNRQTAISPTSRCQMVVLFDIQKREEYSLHIFNQLLIIM